MDQDIKVLANVSLVCNPVRVDDNNINREIGLLHLNMILVPLYIAIIEFGIIYLDIVMFLV